MHVFLEEEDESLIKKTYGTYLRAEAENSRFFFSFFILLQLLVFSPFFVSSHKFVILIPNCWCSSPFFVSSHKFVIPKVEVAFFHVN